MVITPFLTLVIAGFVAFIGVLFAAAVYTAGAKD